MDKIKIFLSSRKGKFFLTGSAVAIIALALIIVILIVINKSKESIINNQNDQGVSYPEVISYPGFSYESQLVSYPTSAPIYFANNYSEVPYFTAEDNSQVPITRQVIFTTTDRPEGFIFRADYGKKLSLNFFIQEMGVQGVECHLEVKNDTFLDARDVVVYNIQSFNIEFDPGVYTASATCKYAGEDLGTQSFVLTVIAPGPSACMDENFEIENVPITLEEIQLVIAGKWHGCAFMWDRKFEVEVTFNENGTYTGTNYEKIVNPNTWVYEWPAFYYGLDNAVGNFEIQNLGDDNSANGKIYIAGNESSMNGIKFTGDINTLYFEVMYRDEYGPLRYKLDRVLE